MAFKEIQSLDCDNTISLGGVNKKTGKKNPVQVEGYFLGSKKTANNKSKSGFSFLHIIQTGSGNVGVWGKTDLDRKLSAVQPGVMIRVTQSGMVPTPNGDMYKYRVEADESNRLDIDLPQDAPAAEEAAADDDVGSFNSGSDEDEEPAEEPVDVAPPRRATPPAAPANTPDAARQAKVRALLAGKRPQ